MKQSNFEEAIRNLKTAIYELKEFRYFSGKMREIRRLNAEKSKKYYRMAETCK